MCICTHFPASHSNLGQDKELQGLKVVDETSLQILIKKVCLNNTSGAKHVTGS